MNISFKLAIISGNGGLLVARMSTDPNNQNTTTTTQMAAPTMTNLTDSLATDSTFKMTSPTGRTADWMRVYMETLINPFSTTLKSPKLLDGEVKNTAAIKLRATGEITCNATGNTNIILFPGLTNVICYCNNPTGTDAAVDGSGRDNVLVDGTVFDKHLSAPADRAFVRLARLTGAGVRFFLTNSADEDDGYWEASRITSQQAQSEYFTKLDSNGSLASGIQKVLATDYNLANSQTYQFGQLRDLYKYVFKLNSEDNHHKYSPISGLNTTVDPGLSNLAELDQWDMIFIKIRGRRNAISPSVLRFDTVANEELVYSEDYPLSRLMDETPRDPNIDGFLTYSRLDLPAFQAIP